MRFLDLTLPTPAENLALDEALLENAEAGSGCEVLRLWESAVPFVVVGYACKLAEDVNLIACRDDRVFVLRRSSGGGTVVQGPGCLNFAMVLDMRAWPMLRDIHQSHELLLDRLMDALRPRFPKVSFHHPCDLALEGLKFSGNAQRRKRDWLLHHGTLLYDFPLASIGRYLHEPMRQPEYRAKRAHASFVTNLPVSRQWLTESLRQAWKANEPLESWPRELTVELAKARHSNPEWIIRR